MTTIFTGNNYLEGEEIKRFVLDLMQRAGHTLTDEQIDHCITVSSAGAKLSYITRNKNHITRKIVTFIFIST